MDISKKEINVLKEYLETESKSLMVHLDKILKTLGEGEDVDEGLKELMIYSLISKYKSFTKGFDIMIKLLGASVLNKELLEEYEEFLKANE